MVHAAPRAPDPDPAARQGACASWSPRARRSTRCRPGAARWSARRRPWPPACARWPRSTAPTSSIVVSITHDHEARRRSYELIAEAFDLAGAPRRASRSPPSGYRQGVADAPAPAPGVRTRPARFVPRLHWELLVCGIAGHELIGLDAAHVRAAGRAASCARSTACAGTAACAATAGSRSPPPAAPAREHPPDRDEIELPLRGRPLRDKIVLRLIAVNRAAALLRARAARLRDPALRLAPRGLPRALLPRRRRPAGRRRRRRRTRPLTACSARSTSSSRCSPRGCTSSPS